MARHEGFRRFKRWALVVVTLVPAVAKESSLSPCEAAQKPVGLKRFAVDFVTLKSGTRLRGAVLGQNADGTVSMAIQRSWLADRRPELLKNHEKSERTEALANATLLQTRIESWRKSTSKPQFQVAFLETELERAKELVATSQAPGGINFQFVVMRFRRSEIASSFVQTAENRQVALIAWSRKLEHVERRELPDLLDELKTEGIDHLADQPVNLADRIPPQPESEQSWTARRAIVDYHYGDKLDFQGMGGALFRTGQGAKKINIVQLLPQFLQSQPGALNIGDILGEPGFGPQRPATKSFAERLKPAIATAEKEGVSGFRVTRLDMNIARRKVTVTQQFIAKMPEGSWIPVWKTVVVGDASKPRPDLQKQIKSDPQIAQVLKLLEALGGARQNQLQVALGFGGATMEAQKTADTRFFEFQDRYLKRLDGPPLELPAN